jgi:parallel beta-helix repeat protein
MALQFKSPTGFDYVSQSSPLPVAIVDGSVPVNVRSYGATGDGTTDDRAAILAAIAAVATAGGTVYFPPGDYYTSSAITVSADTGITLLGAGYASSVKSNTASEGCKFAITGDNVTIRNLRLNGGYVSGGQAGDFGLINVTDCSNTKIEGCYILNSGHLGIRIRGLAVDVAIQGTNIFGNNFCSIQSFDTSNTNVPQRILINGNIFQENWGTGGETGAIKLQAEPSRSGITSGHVVSNNIIKDAGQMGIEIWGHASDCAILGNTIEGTEWGISLDDTIRTTVVGNTCRLFTYAGIESATDTAYNIISGNILDGRLANGSRGANAGIITSNSRPQYIKICDNIVFGINGDGIKLQTTDNSEVMGNTVRDSNNGIVLNGSSNVVVKGNRFYGTFGTFIFIDCYDDDLVSIDISENILTGNASDNGITIFDGDGTMTITGLVLANNNLTAATVTSNDIFDNLGSRLTNYIRVGNQFVDDANSLQWTDGGSSIAPFTPSQQGYGIPVAKRFSFTVPTNVSAQWFKVLSADFGSPIVLWLNIHAFAQGVSNDADNLNVFFGCSPYGFGASGMKLPNSRYEDGIVEEVIYNNPSSGPINEIWIKVKPTTGSYTLSFFVSDFPNDVITSPTFVTTEPTWASNTFKLACDYSGLTTKTLRVSSIPTSSAGLPSGAIWSDGGILNIVS